MKFQPLCFFGTQRSSQLHSEIVHKRAYGPIKPPTLLKDPGEDSTVAPVPSLNPHPLLPTPWLSDLASSGRGCLSLTMAPWVSDEAGRVAEKERKPIYNAAYTQTSPHRRRPSLNWCVVCIVFGCNLGTGGGERKRGRVCVCRRA